MNNTPLVSVVILNYNGMKFIDACFTSLRRTVYSNVEWIMVDNASKDDSIAHVRKNYPEFKIIESGSNLGYTGGNNLGIRAAKGQYVVLLNNDIEVDANWLTHLVNTAEADSQIGALQPKLQSMINKGFFEYAGASGGFIDRWGYPFLRGRIFDTMESDHGQYDDACDIFWASGAALFLRKSALDTIGLLDETFFMHFEEIDLCWRLHRSGFTIKVIPQAIVYHYVSASLPAQNIKKMYWNHRNSLITLFKNLDSSRFVQIIFIRMLLDGISAIYGLFSGEPQRVVAVLKAHFWIYRNYGLLLQKRRETSKTAKLPLKHYSHLIYPRSIVVDYFLKKKKEFHILNF
ncbi:glycosyltransferase family 2 protein [bacterium]|nr:glycosyltransferase family 2 protein [bacterium]